MTGTGNILAALALGIAQVAPAAGQTVSDCGWIASAWNLVEPWEENSRSFANGKTRLALLDTIEPGAAPLHLLLLSPPYDELGGRRCQTIGKAEGIGYAGILFDQLSASYDPARGLTFQVPVMEFDPGNAFMRSVPLVFTLNQATGEITIER